MPVVFLPNRLSTTTAAVNAAITHSHTSDYSLLSFYSACSSSLFCSPFIQNLYHLSSSAYCRSLLFPLPVPFFFCMYCCVRPSPQSKSWLLEAMENRLDWSLLNEGLADRQVITGQCIRADGFISSSVFVSYVTIRTLLFICWMFAWIRHAREQSQMPRRVLHLTHRESEAEENVLQELRAPNEKDDKMQ